MFKTHRARLLLVVVVALCYSFGFAPFSLWPITLLSLSGLAYVLQHAQSKRQAFAYGWLYGWVALGSGISWLFVSVHYYGNVPAPLAVLFIAILAAYMALYVGLAGWLLQLVNPNPKWFALSFAVVWLVGELLRGYVFTGFPWLSAGYTQVDGPLAGFAAVAGVYGIGFLLAYIAAAILFAKSHKLLLLIPLTIVASSFVLNKAVWVEPKGRLLSVAIVQGNISQDKKWQPEWLANTLEVYQRHSVERFGHDLIIWPEVAIPARWYEIGHSYLMPLANDAQRHDTQLMVGLMTWNQGFGGHFNSMVMPSMPSGIPQFYYKKHLVPFGEYFPVPDFVRRLLRRHNIPANDTLSGANNQQPFNVKGVNIAPNICFEDVFGEELVADALMANILVNATNDAWFGDSTQPHQHLEIARMRAMETGRPMLRASNNGLSALINHKGRIVALSKQFAEESIALSVQGMQGRTPYSYWTNIPLMLLIIGFFAVSCGLKYRAIKN